MAQRLGEQGVVGNDTKHLFAASSSTIYSRDRLPRAPTASMSTGSGQYDQIRERRLPSPSPRYQAQEADMSRKTEQGKGAGQRDHTPVLSKETRVRVA
jgi:hypothetical protein